MTLCAVFARCETLELKFSGGANSPQSWRRGEGPHERCENDCHYNENTFVTFSTPSWWRHVRLFLLGNKYTYLLSVLTLHLYFNTRLLISYIEREKSETAKKFNSIMVRYFIATPIIFTVNWLESCDKFFRMRSQKATTKSSRLPFLSILTKFSAMIDQ